MKRFFVGVLYLVLSASNAQAKDPNWLYLTNREDIVQTFQQPPYPTEDRFCVIEGWTPGNSGVYELAKGWKGMILPNAPANPNALSIILSTIDLASDGECDFVAVPWYVPQFRKPIIDRIAANGVMEITGLSALQVGSSETKSDGQDAIASTQMDGSDNTGPEAMPTWRYFAYEHLIRVDPSLFDPLGGMHGRKVCSFGDLTIINSGFPRVAPNWYIFPYSAPTSDQEAIAVTQEVMKNAARSTCLILAVPRERNTQLDLVFGELKKNNMIEIPSMSNPEPPAASVALQQSAPEQSTKLLEKAGSVSREVQLLCSGSPMFSIDFDCGCVAENIRVGISTGELSQISEANYHFNELLKSGDANCINETAIRQDIITQCPQLMVFTFQDANMDCDCLADYAIARFREDPKPRTRYKILLSGPAEARRCTRK